MIDLPTKPTYTITYYGSARSGYERSIRSFARNYEKSEFSLQTVQSNLKRDIACIPRKSTSVASASYEVRVINEYTHKEELEVWIECIRPRKVLSIKKILTTN